MIKKGLINWHWLLKIIVWSFLCTVLIGVIIDKIANSLPIIIAIIVLMIIVLVGIIFDTLGVAVNVADVKKFHAMAANRVDTAKYAVQLIKHAEKVSSLFNDVIGDICGIMSGAIGSGIIYRIIAALSIKNAILVTALFTAIISSLTIGGKALGKAIAINYSEQIVFRTSEVYRFLKNMFNINPFPERK